MVSDFLGRKPYSASKYLVEVASVKDDVPLACLDEHELLLMLLEADAKKAEAAFEVLADIYLPKIERVLFSRSVLKQDLGTLTSTVLFAAWSHRDRLDLTKVKTEGTPFGAWVMGIAKHAASEHFRAEKRMRRIGKQKVDLFSELAEG